jgi:monoamine oxidase
MPTLYTALRARHRSEVVPPSPPLPKSEVFAAPPDKTLLATEQSLAEKIVTPAETVKEKRPTKRIIVIGAGLAGLCAAYELLGLGYDVMVYEARDRVGGRVERVQGFAPGKIAEGGGELIGSNHPLWNSYKHQFNLTFSDARDYGNSPVRLKGATLTFEQSGELTDEMEKQFKLLTNLAATILDPFEPWTNRNAAALDAISVGKWIEKSNCSPDTQHALRVMFAADNGVPVEEQSLLGFLAMVKGGGLDRYWTDTELFRCEGGNQSLAEHFAARLGSLKRPVALGTPVKSLFPSGNRIGVLLDDHGNEKRDEADEVICAVPPSVWKTINVSTFPELAKRFTNPPAMGSNVKYLMRLDNRFWENFASSPTLSEDGPVNLTWETTEADKTGDFVVVAFSGSRDSDECVNWPSTRRDQNYVQAMRDPYPGIQQRIQGTKFMNWPEQEWTLASYYFPRLGEVTSWGPFWKAGYGGWLHFAGEHTCYAFVGYMEGALASGYRLARKLAVRDQVLSA